MTEIFAVSLLEETAFENIRPALMTRVPEVTRLKIGSFLRSNDAQRSLLGELLARHLLTKTSGHDLPDIPFSTGEKGKPGPDGYRGIHFNISHSGNWVVVALSADAVGVDVEKMRKVPEGVAHRFFSEKENKLLNDAAGEAEKAEIFFTLWTLKESFLKAIGTGLTKSLSSFTVVKTGKEDFILADDPEADGYFLKTFYLCEGYKLAACAISDNFNDNVTILTVNDLAG
ncbi:MAG: 4'-phosphopantetheinyl transferase superfamily protein [Bacteroidales bacterium]|nr:4'-phosphopantetheinyl transferase superfamily protein [Bacteroidales bacterium]